MRNARKRVPAPQLVGGGGQQLGFLGSRMNKLVAALARFALVFEDAVHGAGRAEVLAFVQQGGLDGGGGAVLKSLFVQDGQHTGAFDWTEGTSGGRPHRWQSRLGGRGRRRAQDGPL